MKFWLFALVLLFNYSVSRLNEVQIWLSFQIYFAAGLECLLFCGPIGMPVILRRPDFRSCYFAFTCFWTDYWDCGFVIGFVLFRNIVRKKMLWTGFINPVQLKSQKPPYHQLLDGWELVKHLKNSNNQRLMPFALVDKAQFHKNKIHNSPLSWEKEVCHNVYTRKNIGKHPLASFPFFDVRNEGT